MYDVVVIGGGFTGVSAVALLSKKHNTLVMEKESFYGWRDKAFT